MKYTNSIVNILNNNLSFNLWEWKFTTIILKSFSIHVYYLKTKTNEKPLYISSYIFKVCTKNNYIQYLYLILEVEIKLSKFANWGIFTSHVGAHFNKSKKWNEKELPIIFCVRIIAFEALWDFPSMSEADLLRFRTELHRGQSPLNKVMIFQFFGHSFLLHKLFNFLKPALTCTALKSNHFKIITFSYLLPRMSTV